MKPVVAVLGDIVGRPVGFEELKVKPGRRRTLRAHGSRMTAIVKLYASDRATIVASRVDALAAGPPEPRMPSVLGLQPGLRLLVLSDVPGRPLSSALLNGDFYECRRVGAALGAWHTAWEGNVPDDFRYQTAEREREILRLHIAGASRPLADAILEALPQLTAPWSCRTVIHRDLYEEHVLVDERIGLIDVDDAALGPPELDVGNLVAHLELLARRHGRDLRHATRAVLDGYSQSGPVLDQALLDRCRALSLLRLACINEDPALVHAALASGAAA